MIPIVIKNKIVQVTYYFQHIPFYNNFKQDSFSTISEVIFRYIG